MIPPEVKVREGIKSITPDRLIPYVRRAETFLTGVATLGRPEYRRLLSHDPQLRGKVTSFRLWPYKAPIRVRLGTTDVFTFYHLLIRPNYRCFYPPGPVRFIIDAGANVGYASLYFHRRFPKARIVALEPDPSNFRLARQNLACCGDRVALRAEAIWPECRPLHLRFAERADATQVHPAGDGPTCEGIDPLTLLAEAGEERISVFKCDIEGAECDLFAHDPDAWIERTDVALLELHGEEAERTVLPAMARHPFESYVSRDLHVFVRRA